MQDKNLEIHLMIPFWKYTIKEEKNKGLDRKPMMERVC